jgi:hypothetical protein
MKEEDHSVREFRNLLNARRAIAGGIGDRKDRADTSR